MVGHAQSTRVWSNDSKKFELLSLKFYPCCYSSTQQGFVGKYEEQKRAKNVLQLLRQFLKYFQWGTKFFSKSKHNFSIEIYLLATSHILPQKASSGFWTAVLPIWIFQFAANYV